MRRLPMLALIALLLPVAAHAAVDVTLSGPQITKLDNEQRLITTATLANEVTSYTLVYDRNIRDDKPGEATSHWWGWTAGFIPIGMTQPSQANWYWQAFCNWTFDGEDLSKRPAEVRVVRTGQDGVVEYAWDTPAGPNGPGVKASICFVLPSGSDKLLMFGQYEPKTPVKASKLTFSVYPAGFEAPHNRAVTTALGTKLPGEAVKLDLAREHWVLFEDLTPNRPGSGSAGLVIGTPDSFSNVAFEVGGYGMIPTLDLKPEARSFAVGLYDFPALPDFQQTRDYFKQSADSDAQTIGKMAAAGLGSPLPALPLDPQRLATIRSGQGKLFERPAELWRPAKDAAFPWAGKQPGGPINVALFVPRWQAWETMVLAGNMDLKVEHLYFDGSGGLSLPDYWPYSSTTGIGPLPYGVAMQRAVTMAQNPQTEVFLVADVSGAAMPSVARQEILTQVQAGKGLLLVGAGGWPEELLKTQNQALAEQVLAGLAWDQVPGFRGRDSDGDRGRGGPLVQAFDYGQGRVIVLNVRPTVYGALVPAHDEIEGGSGVVERAMAVAARALQAAAKRLPECQITLAVETGKLVLVVGSERGTAQQARVRVQDDLDRTLLDKQVTFPVGPMNLPALPTGRKHFVDVTVQDAQGQTLGQGFMAIPAQPPQIAEVQLAPIQALPGVVVPQVQLPQGGKLSVATQLVGAPANATLTAEVRDAFGRITGRQQTAAKAGPAKFEVSVSRPLTVCHVLDLALTAGGQTTCFERRRFTLPLPYPTDDFTGLLWSYAGGDPVLRATDRACYDWGADMMDLCHMGGYEGSRAAREYQLAAESGLRVIPYVTRIAGTGNDKHERVPCLHDPKYLNDTNAALVKTCTQAQAFSPAAYTLGDENYLFDGKEVCHSAASVAEFQKWLQAKYRTIEALNEAWAGGYGDFADIKVPMLIEEAGKQEVSFAPWLDHKLFMSEAFSNTHDLFRETIRTVDPQAKVGYDGFLGFNWQSGYDFERLGRNLDLNQTYTSDWMQGELMRAFKRPDALTGKWGNSDADNEAGWHSFPWACLLDDDNSVWWWTSWGCDYIPFNPDLSQSLMGKWFFEALRETAQGPGKLLLHAERELSPIAVLHSQIDFHLTDVAYEAGSRSPFAAGGQYLREEAAMMHGLRDAGYQYRHLTPARLMKENLDPAKVKVFFLPYASCLSDAQIALLRDYVQRGGTLVADGRQGMLTAEGKLRDDRPLDELFGVKSESGFAAFKRQSVGGKASLVLPEGIIDFDTTVLEPALRTTTGVHLGKVGEMPVMVVNSVGAGKAILLNMPLTAIDTDRTQPGLQPSEQIIRAALRAAKVTPGVASVTATDGTLPLCLNTVSYRDGGLLYLAVLQDFRVRNLPEQKVTITSTAPSFVYDVRAGKALGKVPQWEATIGRGYPLVYALLPYEVTAVKPQAPATATLGQSLAAKVSLQTTQPAGFHVVRLDVFAPGATTPHRQYSQNLSCPKGLASATIPLALNDAKGQWRLVWRDAATGVAAESKVAVK